jgi:hypothetical protein
MADHPLTEMEFDYTGMRTAFDRADYNAPHHTEGQLMTDQITLEEALELVTFKRTQSELSPYGTWIVCHVKTDVVGDVFGRVWGCVHSDVHGSIRGQVRGTIGGREWEFIETPKEKFQRLLEEKGDQELIEAFNQLEDN